MDLKSNEMSRIRRFGLHLHRAGWNALRHSAFQNSKAAAYSAILSLFPTILAVTTVLALAPEGNTFLGELSYGFSQILPPDTMMLVQTYFQADHQRSLHLILVACGIAFFAAMGLMLAIMEGLRRAERMPRSAWNFWRQRWIAMVLVAGTLVPMFFATALITFGHFIEYWIADSATHALQFYVLFLWRILRWLIALLTSIVVLTMIYHYGIPQRRHWRYALPGATLSTLTWFASSLLFGWYVTHFSHYQVVYGSLGAGMATMVWLYIVSLSILFGAEFNAELAGVNLPEPNDADPICPTASKQAATTKNHLAADQILEQAAKTAIQTIEKLEQ